MYEVNGITIKLGADIIKSTSSTPTCGTSTIISSGTTLNVSSTVVGNGGLAITQRGFVWSTGNTPTINDNIAYANSQFSASFTASTGIFYYMRAFAVNSQGVGYGVTTGFKILTQGVTILESVGEFYLIVPQGITSLEYLCAAGGGGGAGAPIGGWNTRSFGGGGAGGYLAGTVNTPVAGTYKCIVGAGGSGVKTYAIYNGTKGSNSSIAGASLNILCYGGGTPISTGGGGEGGSGAGCCGVGGSALSGGVGISGQGYRGGNRSTFSDSYAGSGGGGAGGTGNDTTDVNTGGAGVSNSITGAAVVYCQGGAGGNTPNTAGGWDGADATLYGQGGKGGWCNGISNTCKGGNGMRGIIVFKLT